MTNEKASVKAYFNKQYSRWSEKNNKEKYCRGYWFAPCQKEALDIVGNINGKSVLVLGVGRGNELDMIKERKAKIIAIDVAIKSFDHQQEKANDEDVKGIVMDVQQMGFADDSFDVIYLQSMLCHVNMELAAKEISRVLKPGGRFILLEEMNNNLWAYLYRKIFSYKSATPYDQFMSQKDVSVISDSFTKEIYDRSYYVFTIIYYILRMLWVSLKTDLNSSGIRFKMTKLVEHASGLFMYIEKAIMAVVPRLKRYALIKLVIFEK